ncbi:MAG TPA: aryl-sulfate sulfotransferase [Thermoanaerobaculia bacterium]|nr:aryl-sulfate sulfotransferase [Thermoanaerobaculia bacterium]
MTPRILSRAATALFISLLAFAAGCSRDVGHADGTAAAEPAAAAQPATDVPPEWVKVYDPARAWNGYTLTLHKARIPVLLDMNGRVVHSWPEARVKSRVRLLPDGSILGIGLGRQVVEYDWEGRKTWEFRTPGALPHHDIVRLANGNTLVMVLREGENMDTVYEVDRAGQVVWTWSAAESLGDLIPDKPSHPHDVTHINSLQELPENPWHAAGDNRFRPGNLLMSARNINTVFVVDRRTGEVVWSYGEGLDMQHEALMSGPGLPDPGMIHIFNNRTKSFHTDRQTEVLAIDPRDFSKVWSFRRPGFYSATAGTQQLLPNGNNLITSTRGHRVFEITREGEVVWEWVTPYQPVRALRVALDACPQLARLRHERPRAVARPRGEEHVDYDSYRFARQGSRMKAPIQGEKRTVLKEANVCRDLYLPVAPVLYVGYGVDRVRLGAAGREKNPPEFRVLSHPLAEDGSAGPAAEILRDTVGLDGAPWRQRTIPLDEHALQAVRICLEIDRGKPGPAGRQERYAYWDQPVITSARDEATGSEDEGADQDDTAGLTPEELEVRKEHLKSLGYIN